MYLNIQISICSSINWKFAKWTLKDGGNLKDITFLLYYKYFLFVNCLIVSFKNLETIVNHMLHTNQIHRICTNHVHI
jgi:hypothetical protein